MRPSISRILLLWDMVALSSALATQHVLNHSRNCQSADEEGKAAKQCRPVLVQPAARIIAPGHTGCLEQIVDYKDTIIIWPDTSRNGGTDTSLTRALGSNKKPGRGQFYENDNSDFILMRAATKPTWTICVHNDGWSDFDIFIRKVVLAPVAFTAMGFALKVIYVATVRIFVFGQIPLLLIFK